jgi:hypothetical protein
MGTELERELESLFREQADVMPPERLARRIESIPGRRRPRRGLMKGARAVAAAIAIVGLVGVGVVVPRLLPTSVSPAGVAGSSTRPTANATATASATGAIVIGCGASDVVVMPTDNDPPVRGFGQAAKPPLDGLAVNVTDPTVDAFVRPLEPARLPAGVSLRASLLTPWTTTGAIADTRLLRIYARSKTDGLNITEIVDGGAWVISEAPAAGRDALSVKASLDSIGADGHYAVVQVGPNRALLVHQDGLSTANGRPYGLHWSDGVRDMSIEVLAPSNEVIDFARSFYCGA